MALGGTDATNVGARATALGAAVFLVIAGLIGLDVAADAAAGGDIGHLVTEVAVMVLALAGAVGLWWQLRGARHEARRLSADLTAARESADRFKQDTAEALRGLGEAIDRQFERWRLSPAEREVGLLLLKGLSHKEIAGIRETGETTIRQQALALYRKAGLRNRAELSAFFLEDLLLPAVESRAVPPPG